MNKVLVGIGSVAGVLLVLGGCASVPCEDEAPWRGEVADLVVPAEPVSLPPEACSTLREGKNLVDTTGEIREVWVRLPPEPEGAPLVFVYHGNERSPDGFLDDVQADQLVAETGAILLAPRGIRREYFMDWAVPPNDPEPDAKLFDDLLACADHQWGIDRTQVSTLGFSAGGVWASWLVGHRAEVLASAVVLSGGTDAPLVFGGCMNPYATPAWRIPVLAVHGGQDQVVLNFNQMATSLYEKLVRDDAPAILCDHGEGHVVPDTYGDWAWPWLTEHRFGEVSPWSDGSDPSGALPRGCRR